VEDEEADGGHTGDDDGEAHFDRAPPAEGDVVICEGSIIIVSIVFLGWRLEVGAHGVDKTGKILTGRVACVSEFD
jgi:hypothetical protein